MACRNPPMCCVNLGAECNHAGHHGTNNVMGFPQRCSFPEVTMCMNPASFPSTYHPFHLSPLVFLQICMRKCISKQDKEVPDYSAHSANDRQYHRTCPRRLLNITTTPSDPMFTTIARRFHGPGSYDRVHRESLHWRHLAAILPSIKYRNSNF